MATVKMLKKDALIPLQVGTGFVQKIQSMLMALVDERSPEDIEILQKLAQSGQELPEPWMEHIQVLMILLNELDKSAEANGMTVEKSVDDAISEQES
jgi:hypothetical protein